MRRYDPVRSLSGGRLLRSYPRDRILVRRFQLLGIDFGTARLRVAIGERTPSAKTRLRAIASRDLPDPAWKEGGNATEFVGMILEELVREIGSRKKECVTACGLPRAAMRCVRFPRMTWLERRRAARFEALEIGARDLVRIHPNDRGGGVYSVGTVDAFFVRLHAEIVRRAGLRLVAIDHDGYALQRALPEYDAIADVGYETMRLHVFSGDELRSWAADCGGRTVTQGVAADLAIDDTSAERRKRILGTAGAGAPALDGFVHEFCRLVERAVQYHRFSRVALVGNGARLPGFRESVLEHAGLDVELPVADVLRTGGFSDEVLQTAAPDWTLAAALSGWEAA